MTRRSLRSRLMVATVMWATGVLAASFVVGRVVLMFHPGRVLLIHNSFIIIIATVLITAGVSVIRRGLSPFVVLRERLQDVRSGRTSRLEGEYPIEVEPLVDDLNTLLEEREHRVSRAVAKAGDLAHGLKTPLAILAQEIDRATAAGQSVRNASSSSASRRAFGFAPTIVCTASPWRNSSIVGRPITPYRWPMAGSSS